MIVVNKVRCKGVSSRGNGRDICPACRFKSGRVSVHVDSQESMSRLIIVHLLLETSAKGSCLHTTSNKNRSRVSDSEKKDKSVT